MPLPAPTPEPVTTTVTETKPIAFQRSTRNDSSLPKGQTKVATVGVEGVIAEDFDEGSHRLL